MPFGPSILTSLEQIFFLRFRSSVTEVADRLFQEIAKPVQLQDPEVISLGRRFLQEVRRSIEAGEVRASP